MEPEWLLRTPDGRLRSAASPLTAITTATRHIGGNHVNGFAQLGLSRLVCDKIEGNEIKNSIGWESAREGIDDLVYVECLFAGKNTVQLQQRKDRRALSLFTQTTEGTHLRHLSADEGNTAECNYPGAQ